MTNGQWPSYQPYPPQGSPYGPPPKQRGSGLGWLALAVAVIVAVGIGVFFVLTKDADSAATTSTAPPIPEPATSSAPAPTPSASLTPTIASPTPGESPAPSIEPSPTAPTSSGVQVPELPGSFGAFSAVTTLTPQKGTWADYEGISFTVTFTPNRTWDEDVLWDDYTQIRELGEYWCAIPKDAELKKTLNAICLTEIYGGLLFTSMDGSHMTGDTVIVDKVIDRATVLDVTKQFVAAWQQSAQDG